MRCGFHVRCNPTAGSLIPVALRSRFSSTQQEVLRAVVTTPISKGTVLGFRFFGPTEGYLSPMAVPLNFALEVDIEPGQFIQIQRLAPGFGTALMAVTFPTPCAEPIMTLLGRTVTELTDAVTGASCYLYWSPPPGCKEAALVPIAAIAGPGIDAGSFLPPPCVLPCKFAIVPGVTHIDGDYVVLSDKRGCGVPGTWYEGAWQLSKAHPWACLLDADLPWTLAVDSLCSQMYTVPRPGALVPIGVRPHVADSPFVAQLVLVATAPISSGTRIQVTAQCTYNSATPQAYWQWTAVGDVAPGTVIDMAGLSLLPGVQPSVNTGIIARVPAAGDDDGSVAFTDFTVFVQSPCDPEARHNVTALYTCARPPGVPLPLGLSAGASMPTSPWPGLQPALVPLTVKPEAWPMAVFPLCAATPVPWISQPTPCMRRMPLALP